jgi:hypothetical protein
MINEIKIYGERNSGTNFLKETLENNLLDIKVLDGCYKSNYGWKHGYPNINKYNKTDTILFIFIIRDLDKWCKSMYNNYYHYEKPYNISDFLENPIINEENKDHDVNKNIKELYPIIKLRNEKIKSYFEFYKKIENGIFINLEDIQKDGGYNFVDFLNKNYKLNIKKDFVKIIKHTKNKKNIQNRTYNIFLPKNIIKKYIDFNLEYFIFNLKNNYFYKYTL